MSQKRYENRDQRFRFICVPREPGWVPPPVTYELLAVHPKKIECWMKRFTTDTRGVTRVLLVSSVDSLYTEKCMSNKWQPNLQDLANEKTAGRGEIRFMHVPFHRYEIGLTYFGDVLTGKAIRVTDIDLGKEEDPKIMQQTVLEEFENYLPFAEEYTEDKIKNGYESRKIDNLHLKLMMEEDVERWLDNAGFIFSDDGTTYTNI